MARLPYIARDDLPEDKHPVFDRIAERRGGPESGGALPHSFALLLNSPDAAEAVGALGEYVRFRSPLDPAAREIAILAAAMEMGSEYVWKHHEPVARRAGVRDTTHRGHPVRQSADGPARQRGRVRAGRAAR